MVLGDRMEALETLGVSRDATQEEIEAAHRELRAVWEPQLDPSNPRLAARAEEELRKIDLARDTLRADPDTAVPTGFRPIALGLGMILAFGLGFGGMRAYRRSHTPPATIVRDPFATTREDRFRLTAPEVSISAVDPDSPPLSSEDRETLERGLEGLKEGIDAMEARDALISLNEKAIGPVTRALGSPDENVRMNAAMVINSIALGPDDSPNDKAEVKRLHPYFADALTVEALAKLTDDPNAETRLNVAYALGNLRDPAGYQPLLRMAEDESTEVRAGVAYGLQRLGNPEAVSTLVRLLEDSEITVRMAAVEALRPYDTPEAKSALAQRLPMETDPEIIARIKSVLEGEKSPEDEEP